MSTHMFSQRLKSWRNGLSLGIANALNWSPGAYRERAARALTLNAAAASRAAALVERYGVRFEQELSAATSIANYEYLDMLDRMFGTEGAWPDAIRQSDIVLHDVGSASFWLRPACMRFSGPLVSSASSLRVTAGFGTAELAATMRRDISPASPARNIASPTTGSAGSRRKSSRCGFLSCLLSLSLRGDCACQTLPPKNCFLAWLQTSRTAGCLSWLIKDGKRQLRRRHSAAAWVCRLRDALNMTALRSGIARYALSQRVGGAEAGVLKHGIRAPHRISLV